MDIATYNHAETDARAGLSSWRFQQFFSPAHFENVGFPARIDNIGQFRGLLSGMHDAYRIGSTLAELDGLRDRDLDRIARAVGIYLRWFRSCFADEAAPIPLSDLLSCYLAYTKLQGLDQRQRLLEVGAGYGLTALFVSDDERVKTYDLVEITQSLYLMQASLCSNIYGERFRNAAHRANPQWRLGQLGRDRSQIGAHQPMMLRIPRAFRCSLFPWWEIDEPLSGQYDVIMSNANIFEMSPSARVYYFENWKRALAKTGHLLIQDFGHSLTMDRDQAAKLLNFIDGQGYRALVKYFGEYGNRKFDVWNLLLVTEGHPDYESAKSVLEKRVLEVDNGIVRQVYGFDREPGRKMTADEILQQVSARLGRS